MRRLKDQIFLKLKLRNRQYGEILKYGDYISGHYTQGHVDTVEEFKIKIVDKT